MDAIDRWKEECDGLVDACQGHMDGLVDDAQMKWRVNNGWMDGHVKEGWLHVMMNELVGD